MSLRDALRRRGWIWAVPLALALAGCTSPTRKAPVEERSPTAKPPAAPTAAASVPAAPSVEPAPAAPAVAASAPLPGAENAGKPGYRTVKPGETLMRIALESGQSWRDIARWNNIENPNVVEVGQVLRVVPPPGEVRAGAPRAAGTAASAPAADARPPDPKPAATASVVPSAPAAAPEGTAEDNVVWTWPASGPVINGFDEGRNKGLTIGGSAGDPVLAAGDGRVVYAGSSLRGYGNLVIVKHSEVFLTAYAHNQTLLVKEDQVVRRGQKIAEMGSSDASRVQLHFEIRRQGKPIDPATLLPPR